MAKNSQVNLIKGPVEMAALIHEGQQEGILNYIQGPREQTRRTLVGGQPVDNIVERVMQRIRAGGL
jgi:hypothetical protein